MPADRQLARDIILEILRQAGGELPKTLLFKAFWLAHLYHAKRTRGFLSAWPIVRMPYGPGIHQGDSLLVELLHAGQIESRHVEKGPFVVTRFPLRDQVTVPRTFPPVAIARVSAG